jgi:hypothetical protein
VDGYFEYENYSSNGKKAFYGFHWREYSGPELARLFSRAGFAIQSCELLVTFQDGGKISVVRKLLRQGTRLLAQVLPRYATDVCLTAERQN